MPASSFSAVARPWACPRSVALAASAPPRSARPAPPALRRRRMADRDRESGRAAAIASCPHRHRPGLPPAGAALRHPQHRRRLLHPCARRPHPRPRRSASPELFPSRPEAAALRRRRRPPRYSSGSSLTPFPPTPPIPRAHASNCSASMARSRSRALPLLRYPSCMETSRSPAIASATPHTSPT